MFVVTQTVLVLLLSAFVIADVAPSDCDGQTPSTYSLCQEFQAIGDLAPHHHVISIIQTHMKNDIRFRKAVQYMLSSQFAATTRQIDNTASYQNILRHFTRAGVNTTDINSVYKIFNCIILPVIREATGVTMARSANGIAVGESRSLDTVLVEVNQLISHEALVRLLNTNLSVNPQYLAFYRIVRQASFQDEVLQGFRNSEVARPIKTLRRYQIDLCKMVQYAFNIFAQGPEVEQMN